MPMTKGGTSLGSMTYATLVASYPASSYTGWSAYVSDWGANGTSVRSNGSRWLPVNGLTVLKRMGGAVSGIANTETIIAKVQVPAGAIQAGDVFRISLSVTKTGTTNNVAANIRIGTAGTVSDSAVTGYGTNFMGAASVSGGYLLAIRVLSNTSVQRMGNGSVSSSYGGATSAIALSAPTTGLSDFSSNANWITFTLNVGTTDTGGVQELTIIQEAG